MLIRLLQDQIKHLRLYPKFRAANYPSPMSSLFMIDLKLLIRALRVNLTCLMWAMTHYHNTACFYEGLHNFNFSLWSFLNLKRKAAIFLPRRCPLFMYRAAESIAKLLSLRVYGYWWFSFKYCGQLTECHAGALQKKALR